MTLDARVLARRQKDLDGYVEGYQNTVDAQIAKYAKDIKPIWQRTAKRLDLRIKQLFKQYANDDGSLDEDKLRSLSYQIDRLEVLKRQILQDLQGVEGVQQGKLLNNMAYQYTNSYYNTAFFTEKAAQVRVMVPLLTTAHVMGVVANPWLPDGATYSDRLRANTAYLAGKMYDSVGRATVEGWNVNKTALRVQEVANEGYYNSVRLARTELTRAAGQGASFSYMQNADILDGKRWNATLDKRTAPRDAHNDGKVYELNYDTPENPGRQGERIPNHPNCRCIWSPVLSSLGVSTQERIARTGDSTESWGENTYTKARTYREYAKERGLPDLDERLANDNPANYLRRGEKLEVAPAVKPAVIAPAVVPVVPTFAEKVQARIAQGVNTEADVREVGDLVRQELESQLPAELKEQIAEHDRLYKEARKAWVSDNNRVTGGADENYGRMIENRNKRDRLTEQYREELGKAAKSVLGQVRPLGNDGVQLWPKGGSKPIKDLLTNEVFNYLPRDWLRLSNKTELKTKKAKRGHYMQVQPGVPVAELALSGEPGSTDMLRCALHEMGHRFEDVVPRIRQIEKEFYQRRTAGEAAVWLGPGYRYDERTRKDHFVSPYMGKDYDDGYYELVSMGIESVFRGTYAIADDEDYYNFILGVLAAL